MDNQFKFGDRVQFTQCRVRISATRTTVKVRTISGTIIDINEKGVARIKINRSKNCCTCHISHLRHQGKMSALTEAFIDAVSLRETLS